MSTKHYESEFTLVDLSPLTVSEPAAWSQSARHLTPIQCPGECLCFE